MPKRTVLWIGAACALLACQAELGGGADLGSGGLPSAGASAQGGSLASGGASAQGGSPAPAGGTLGGTGAGAPPSAGTGPAGGTSGASGTGGVAAGAAGDAGTSGSSGGAGSGAGGDAGSAGAAGAASGNGGSGGASGSGGSGGMPGGAGGVSGGSGGGGGSGSGGTPTCAPGCGSHKFACWPMPNPASTGLPNPSSYTDMGDVVHDDVTCLDWQKSPPNTTYTVSAALAYCEGLTLGAYSDWRLPTRVEMASITDWTRSSSIDAAFTARGGYHKTASSWYVSITGSSDFAWMYNMSDGITSNARAATAADYARCVRGNGSGEAFDDLAVPPPNQYSALSNDEVQDNYTGLIWQRDGDAAGLMAWENAVTYCDNLTLGGNTNWRLPSIRELATLVDEGDVAPSIHETMFPNTNYGSYSNNWYWASHLARNSTASWGLNFDDGFTGFNSGSSGAWNYWTAAYAKCVR